MIVSHSNFLIRKGREPMKMIYNGTPINSMKVKHYEMDTNSATVKPSDLQAGVTCFGKGKKITGTGKAFEFAMYGTLPVNSGIPIPTVDINTILISSTDGSVRMINEIDNLRDLDFSIAQEIAKITLNGTEQSLTVQIVNNRIIFGCSQNTFIQVMIGKDNFI